MGRLALGLALLLTPMTARAQPGDARVAPDEQGEGRDWLVVLPECAHPKSAHTPAPALLYPRVGLPALVHAGDTLVARVRLPTPLTPPPGIQQPRALERWTAVLVGDGIPIGPQPLEARLTPQVTDVRPDGPQSRVYRASIAIPAWLAPGTYDLGLRTPGGRVETRGQVRVLRRGRPVRFGFWPRSWPSRPMPNSLAAAEVDVWLRVPDVRAVPEPEAGPVYASLSGGGPITPAPMLDPTRVVAALRIGRRLHMLGACEDRYLGYERQVAARAEALRLQRSRPPRAPAEIAVPSDARGDSLWTGRDALRVRPGAAGLVLALARDAPAAVTLTALAPFEAETRLVDGGALHPAHALAAFGVGAPIAARVRLAPGERRMLRLERAEAMAARLSLAPAPVAAGRALRVALESAPPHTRLALQVDGRRSHFTADGVELRLRRPGLRPLAALALSADGRVQPLRADAKVVTARSGCSIGRPPGVPVPPTPAARWVLMAAGWLVMTRRLAKKAAVAPTGNILGRATR